MTELRELPVFGGTLDEIVGDVDGVVTRWQAAAGDSGDYRNLGIIVPLTLALEKERMEEHLREVLQRVTILKGKEFMVLSPQQRRKIVYEISGESVRDKDNRNPLETRLDQLYQAFLDQTPTERGKWGAFLAACGAFHAVFSRGIGRDIQFSAPFPMVFETFTIDLPSLTPVRNFAYDGTGPVTAKQNTRLQIDLARAIGVLLPEETLSGFLRKDRATIRIEPTWDEFRRAEKEEPKAIIAMRAGRYGGEVFGGGIPSCYSQLTKYPGVRAHIRFEVSGGYERMLLDELLDDGHATAGITLHTPTELFFPPERHS